MAHKILSTVIGSYPKPGYVIGGTSGRDLLNSSGAAFREQEKLLGREAFHRLLDRAVDETIQDQEDASIDIITDGEQRRCHYVYHVLRKLDGFDFRRLHSKTIYKVIKGEKRAAFEMCVPKVASSIKYRGEILVPDFRYLAERTQKDVKATLPGPTTVVDCVINDFYDTDHDLALDYALAIRSEVSLLREAGCKLFQFDDPGLLRDLVRAETWGVQTLEACFSGIEGITTIVHVCRSYPNEHLDALGTPYKSDEGYYSQLLQVLQHSKVDQISIEAKQGGLNPGALKHLGNKTLLLGCLDPGSERVESVGEILDLAQAAFARVAPERLILAPDCGLLQVSRTVAKEKLGRLAEATATLNHRLSN
jgi:5-methyltetrahydropteroyltriglutamate--homocysteine methyltransferase